MGARTQSAQTKGVKSARLQFFSNYFNSSLWNTWTMSFSNFFQLITASSIRTTQRRMYQIEKERYRRRTNQINFNVYVISVTVVYFVSNPILSTLPYSSSYSTPHKNSFRKNRTAVNFSWPKRKIQIRQKCKTCKNFTTKKIFKNFFKDMVTKNLGANFWVQYMHPDGTFVCFMSEPKNGNFQQFLQKFLCVPPECAPTQNF